jgi:hypothetical protein
MPADRPETAEVRDGDARPRLPVVIVPDRPKAYAAASAIAEATGLHVRRGWSLPARPWDLAERGLVVAGAVCADTVDEELLDAVVRGAGAIIGFASEGGTAARVRDALRRVAPVLDHQECHLLRLDVEQIWLLQQLAVGADTRQAAEAVHLSVRTAHRRLAEARATLDAPSTMAAAVQVQSASSVWTT